MADGFTRMRDFLDKVEDCTREGRLMHCGDLVQQLMMCRRATNAMRFAAVLDQVEIAKGLGRKEWLRRVANDALDFQFNSREWISKNIFSLGKERKRFVSDMPTGRSRDIRIKTDPNLERREETVVPESTATSTQPSIIQEVENQQLTLDVSMDVSIPSEEERTLLAEGEPLRGQPEIQPALESSDYPVPPVPWRDLVREFEPAAVIPTWPTFPPEEVRPKVVVPDVRRRPRSPVRHPSEQRLPDVRSKQRLPYRESTTVKTQIFRQRPSSSRSQERHHSDKRRRLEREPTSTLPRVHGVTVEDASRRMDKSDGKSKIPPRKDFSITIYQKPAETAKPQSEQRNSKQRRAVAKTMKRKNQQSPCPVSGCDVPNNYPKAHAFASHVPNLFDEDLDVEDVTCRRLAALKLAAVWLLGMRGTVQELMVYVDSMGLLSGDANRDVSTKQSAAMKALCEEMCIESPEVFTLYPMNSPACLFHWRAMLLIVAQLEPRHRNSLMDQFQYFQLEVAAQPEVMEVIQPRFPDAYDSHFHLDRSRDHHSLSTTASLKQLCAKVRPNDEARVTLVGAVANFCDPDTYPTREEVAEMHHQGLKICIGMHPNPRKLRSITENHLAEMKKLLELPEVSGLGEVGLDHTATFSRWYPQLQILNKVVGFLQDRHVLVLHCRGIMNEDPSEVYSTVLMHLKGRVRKEQPIHVHCFTGNRQIVEAWLEEFPRTFFGFTRLVKNFTRAQLEGLRAVGDDRILLETDAPYFKFPGHSAKHSAPNLIGMTAEVVAEARKSTVLDLLLVSTGNAKHLYGEGLKQSI